MKENMVWLIARFLSSFVSQEVSGFMGFQTIHKSVPERLTTIDYYPVINQPTQITKRYKSDLDFPRKEQKMLDNSMW